MIRSFRNFGSILGGACVGSSISFLMEKKQPFENKETIKTLAKGMIGAPVSYGLHMYKAQKLSIEQDLSLWVRFKILEKIVDPSERVKQLAFFEKHLTTLTPKAVPPIGKTTILLSGIFSSAATYFILENNN